MLKKHCPDGSDVKARLIAILDRIRRLRRSHYPADWTADPLYRLEQDIASLLSDMKNA